MIKLPNGVNCTMLAPYTEAGRVDCEALDEMISWYARKGCKSLFAMCHSTEMHMLTMAERLLVIRRARARAEAIAKPGEARMPIIAAGTFSNDPEEMNGQIRAVYDAGADAVVIVTNRLDPENAGGDGLIRQGEALLRTVPAEIPLGLYECPLPYKRVLTAREMRWAVESGRVCFLKDTCCDPDLLRQRLALARGSGLKLFNANSQTLLMTLREGAAGYSSVMANIHPQLYAWLCANFGRYPAEAEHLQHIACFTAFAESLSYPLVAKYVMRKEGVPVEINSRMRNEADFTPYHAHIMDQLLALTEREMARLPAEAGS